MVKESYKDFKRTEDQRAAYQLLNKRANQITSFGGNVLGGFINQRKRQMIYARDSRRQIIGSGSKKAGGGRGRPRGSFDSRYAQYGGVYGYRKALAIRNAQIRAQLLRDRAVTPQQQQILAQIEARNRMQQMSPENQTIPDTQGVVRTRSIHQEIDDAANLVP